MDLSQDEMLKTVRMIVDAMMEGKTRYPGVVPRPFIVVMDPETEEFVYQNFDSCALRREMSNVAKLLLGVAAPRRRLVIYGAEVWASNTPKALRQVMSPTQDPDRRDAILVEAHSAIGVVACLVFFRENGAGIVFDNPRIRSIAKE